MNQIQSRVILPHPIAAGLLDPQPHDGRSLDQDLGQGGSTQLLGLGPDQIVGLCHHPIEDVLEVCQIHVRRLEDDRDPLLPRGDGLIRGL